MSIFRWLVALFSIFAMVIFGVQNMQRVRLQFYGWEQEIELFFLMALLLLIGALLAAVVGVADQVRIRSRSRRLTRQVKALEEEIAGLRQARPEEPGPEISPGEPPA